MKRLNSSKTGQKMYVLQYGMEYLILLMMYGAYLAKLTNHLGFSDESTGILAAVISLGHLFQLVSIFFRRKRVKSLVVTLSILWQAFFVFLYLTPIFPFSAGFKRIFFAAVMLAAYFLFDIAHPKKIQWLMGHVGDGIRGRFTAVKEMARFLLGMGFTFGLGALMDHFEAVGKIKEAFVLCALIIFVLSVVHIIALVCTAEREQTFEKRRSVLSAFGDKKIWKLTVVFVLWYAATYASTPFYGTFQNKELGFSLVFVSVLNLIHYVARISTGFIWGAFADKRSFATMLKICFAIEAAGYLFIVFIRPDAGKLLFAAYQIFYAVAMAGISSALINLVYDEIAPERRADAIAVTQAIAGVGGFITTILVSRLVAYIQQNSGLFGISVYAQQVTSLLSFLLEGALVLFMIFAFRKRR